jgi:hypothetical protein
MSQNLHAVEPLRKPRSEKSTAGEHRKLGHFAEKKKKNPS